MIARLLRLVAMTAALAVSSVATTALAQGVPEEVSAARESVFRIVVPGQGFGSGFAIAPDLIMTNFHVIDGVSLQAGDRVVAFNEDIELEVTEIIPYRMVDLAVLRVPNADLRLLEFCDAEVMQDTVVWSIGYPATNDVAGFDTVAEIAEGLVKQSTDSERVQTFAERAIVHSAPINNGSSGGPLLDSEGRVVGINSGTGEDVSIGFQIGSRSPGANRIAVPSDLAVEMASSQSLPIGFSVTDCTPRNTQLERIVLVSSLAVVVAIAAFFAIRYFASARNAPVAAGGGSGNLAQVAGGQAAARPAGPTTVAIGRLAQGQQMVIGRSTSSDVVVSSPHVGKRHAILSADARGYWLEDAGSINGTFVDGRRLAAGQKVQVTQQSSIRLADREIRLDRR